MIDILINNQYLYLVLLVMIMGAFILGYLLSSILNKRPTSSTTIASQVSSKLEKLEKEQKRYSEQLARVERKVEIDDLGQPGVVRATKTRDRSGNLSDNTIEKSTDHDNNHDLNLGSGDKKNKDDFQKIVGIGPLVEEKLNNIGIYNYAQLAAMQENDIEKITKLIDFFPGRIHRDDWAGQARDLMKIKN